MSVWSSSQLNRNYGKDDRWDGDTEQRRMANHHHHHHCCRREVKTAEGSVLRLRGGGTANARHLIYDRLRLRINNLNVRKLCGNGCCPSSNSNSINKGNSNFKMLVIHTGLHKNRRGPLSILQVYVCLYSRYLLELFALCWPVLDRKVHILKIQNSWYALGMSVCLSFCLDYKLQHYSI